MNFPSQFHFNPLSQNRPGAEPALALETERLRQLLRSQQPDELAHLVGAFYSPREDGRDTLSLELWGEALTISFPGLIACREPSTSLPLPVQALLMFYLTTSDGFKPTGDWVSFSDLPGGRIYALAFQGYSGDLLTRTFGEDIQAFRSACLSAGGETFELADAAFSFSALPHVPLLVTYWLGEDELPSTSKVLFDPTASHHLPIDVCAILGGMLVSRILKHKS